MNNGSAEDHHPRSLLFKLLCHAVLCLVAVAMLYPLLWMVSSSLKPQDEIFNSSPWPASFDFSSYVRGWYATQVSFTTYYLNSLTISAFTVIGNTISCSLAAFAFARLRFPGRNVLFALMLLTLMLPEQVMLIPQYMLFFKLGWINTFLPLIVPKFLAADAFFIFLMVQFFRGIPKELDEAAMMDGCSHWRIYWRIIMPLSVPVLATTAVFTFIWTWDDFLPPLIYLSGAKNYTVQLGLRSFGDQSGVSDWSALMAMSVVALIPVLILFVFFQRLLIEGIATSGMKR